MGPSPRRTSHSFGSVSFTKSSSMAVAAVLLCFILCTQHTVGWSAEVPLGRGAAPAEQSEDVGLCKNGQGPGCSGGGEGGGSGDSGEGQRAVEDMVRYLQGERKDVDDHWEWEHVPAQPLQPRAAPSPEETPHRLPQQERLLRMLEYDFSPLVEDILLAKARRFAAAAAAAKAPAAPRTLPQAPGTSGIPPTGPATIAQSPPEDKADAAGINAKLELEKVVKKAIEKSDSFSMTTATPPLSNGTVDHRAHAADVTVQEMLVHILAKTTAKAFDNSGTGQTTEQVLRGPKNETVSKTLGEERFRRARVTTELIKKMLKRSQEKLKLLKKRSLLAPSVNSNTAATTSHDTLTSEVKHQRAISKSTTNSGYNGKDTDEKVLPNNSDSTIVAFLTGKPDAHNNQNLTERTQKRQNSQNLTNFSSTENIVKIKLPKAEDKVAPEKEPTKRNIKFLKSGFNTNMEDDDIRRDRDMALKEIAAVLSKANEKVIDNFTDLPRNTTGDTPLKTNEPKFGESPLSGGVFIRTSIIQPKQLEFEAEVDEDGHEKDADRHENYYEETIDVDDMFNFQDPNPAVSMIESFEFESPFFGDLDNQFTDQPQVDDEQFLNSVSNRERRTAMRKTKTIHTPDWNVEFPSIEETLKDVFQRVIEDNILSARRFQRRWFENKRVNDSRYKLEKSPKHHLSHKRDVVFPPTPRKQKRVAQITGLLDNDVHISPLKLEKSQNDEKNLVLEVTKANDGSMVVKDETNTTDTNPAMTRDINRLSSSDDNWNTEKDTVQKLNNNTTSNPHVYSEESSLPRVQLTLDDIHISNVLSGIAATFGGEPGQSHNKTEIGEDMKGNDHQAPESISADHKYFKTEIEHEKEIGIVKGTMIKEDRTHFESNVTNRSVHKNVSSQDVHLKIPEETSSLTGDKTSSNVTNVLGNNSTNAAGTASTNDSSTTKNQIHEKEQALNLDAKKIGTEDVFKTINHGKDLLSTAMTVIDSLQLLNNNLIHAIPNMKKRDTSDITATESERIPGESAAEAIMTSSSLLPSQNYETTTNEDKHIDSEMARKITKTQTELPEEELGERVDFNTTEETKYEDLKFVVNAGEVKISNGSNEHRVGGGNDIVPIMQTQQHATNTTEHGKKMDQPVPKMVTYLEANASSRVGDNSLASGLTAKGLTASGSTAKGLTTKGLTASPRGSHNPPPAKDLHSLHCYQCRSDRSPKCGSRKPDRTFLTPCSFEDPQPRRPMCRVTRRKVATGKEEGQLVIRSCARESDMAGGGCYKSRWDELMTCDCATNGCNEGIEVLMRGFSSGSASSDGPFFYAAPVSSAAGGDLENPELRSSVPRLESPCIYITAIVVPLVTFLRTGLRMD